MSAAEAVLRVLEELRQSALTEALGQVTCSTVYRHNAFEPCSDCGACV